MEARATGRWIIALNVTLLALGVVACGNTGHPYMAPSHVRQGLVADAASPAGGHWYPIDKRTPGHLCTGQDPDFDEYRYSEEIAHCRRNVTKAMRVAVSEPYGVSEAELENYQVDHLIPLALGGSNARENLWPVPYEQARAKAKFEYQTYLAIKDGEITQNQAIARIRLWVKDNFIF
jgi:hypothetical protein